MLIKVSCPCGSRFSFDVEPVNGQMPVNIACPSCSADATGLANEEITRALTPAAPAQPARPAFTIQGMPAGSPAAPPAAPGAPQPPAPSPAPEPAPAPEPPAAGGLRIRSSKHHPDPNAGGAAAPGPAPAPAIAASGPAPGTGGGLTVKTRAHEPAAAAAEPAPAGESNTPLGKKPMHISGGYIPKEGPEPQFMRGVGGAFAGAALGGIIWYAIFRLIEIDLNWMVLIPACISGWFTRWWGRQDNTILGGIAAFATLLALFCVRYLIVMGAMEEDLAKVHAQKPETYEEHMAIAKRGAALKTDDEIADFLREIDKVEFERIAAPGEKYPGRSVLREDISFFRQYEIPEYQKFVDGEPSREEFEAANKMMDEEKEAATWITRIGAAVGAIFSVGIFGLFTTIFALAVAYRIGSG